MSAKFEASDYLSLSPARDDDDLDDEPLDDEDDLDDDDDLDDLDDDLVDLDDEYDTEDVERHHRGPGRGRYED